MERIAISLITIALAAIVCLIMQAWRDRRIKRQTDEAYEYWASQVDDPEAALEASRAKVFPAGNGIQETMNADVLEYMRSTGLYSDDDSYRKPMIADIIEKYGKSELSPSFTHGLYGDGNKKRGLLHRFLAALGVRKL